MVVEHKDARLRPGAAIEIGCREPADATTHHNKVVAFLRREPAGRIMNRHMCDRMGGLKATDMLSAQAGKRRRVAGGLGRNLHRGREPGRDRQRKAVEEIAAGNLAHSQSSCALADPGFAPNSGIVTADNGGTMSQKYAS